MKILITGASGFIGKYLKNYFSNKHEVITPTSKELDLTNEELVSDFFKDKYFDAIIHSAVIGRNSVFATDSDIGVKIISMFTNIVKNNSHFGKLINFGSGAEFGLDHSVDDAREADILNVVPIEGYGFAKNLISRSILNLKRCYNLRVFACIDISENEQRLFKKFKNIVDQGRVFELDQDRYVDFVSLHDIAIVVSAVLDDRIMDTDLNVVYQDKCMVSTLLNKYCEVNDINPSLLKITGITNKNYTGNGNILAGYNLALEGIVPTLKKYKEQNESL